MFGGSVLAGRSVSSSSELWKFSFADAMWTWMVGSTNLGAPGVLGEVGTPSQSNYPSASSSLQTWMTTSPKKLWLYGSSEMYNEFWSYEISTRQWTLMATPSSESRTSNAYPGLLYYGFAFSVDNNQLFIFGGSGRNGFSNALWRYKIDVGTWTFMGGNGTSSYGSIGVPDASNYPPPRRGASGGYDPVNRRVVVVGSTPSVETAFGSDVWSYDVDNNVWTWIYGDSSKVSSFHLGPGETSELNSLGDRSLASVVYDESPRRLWIFGGISGQGAVEDVWLFGYGNYTAPFMQPTPSVLPQPRFTWFRGSPSPDQLPSFGTKGIARPENTPGSLFGPCALQRKPSELWTWGGNIWNRPGGEMNAFWMYSTRNNTWTWMHGTNATFYTADQQNGNYGVLLEPSPDNMPPARYNAACWYDPDADEFWMFGGATSGNSPRPLNDLWRFSFSTMIWTWMGGSQNLGDPGVFNSVGTSSIFYYPSGRAGSYAFFTKNPKTLWLYGGADRSATLEDFWSYDVATGSWKYLDFRARSFGARIAGQESPDLFPGLLEEAFAFTVNDSQLYIFSGWSPYERSNTNLLWRYNIESGNWAWMGGDGTSFSYGNMSVSTPSNYPPPKSGPCGAYDATRRKAVIFGGYGGGSEVWLYDVDSNAWTWEAGTQYPVPSTYDLPAVTDERNIPGSRSKCRAWYDPRFRDLWLFGGSGRDSGFLDDVWLFSYGQFSYSVRESNVSNPPSSAPVSPPPTLVPIAPEFPPLEKPAAPTQNSDTVNLTIVIIIQLNRQGGGPFSAEELNSVLSTVRAVIAEFAGILPEDIQIRVEPAPPRATLTIVLILPVSSIARVTSSEGSSSIVTQINARASGKFAVVTSSTTTSDAHRFAQPPLLYAIVGWLLWMSLQLWTIRDLS
eukprot:TRINITY_DN3217_c0_g2_i1.p1 TRINITY_DN3217_c0_g2~~TRINITY_DN3217_c0_g2_i1.p1  ORF type:complete len:899 (+),score=96.05 TRINITY_DN3217_c0_g2_i1:110-2806(+)